MNPLSTNDGIAPNRQQIIDLIKAWNNSLKVQPIIMAELHRFNHDQVIDILAGLIYDPDRVIQDIAIKVLAQFDPQRSVNFLVPLLKHPEGAMRWHICDLLAQLGAESAMEPLIQVLRQDPESDVRSMAAFALGQVGDSRAIPDLEYAKDHDSGTDLEGLPIADVAEQAIASIRLRHPFA